MNIVRKARNKQGVGIREIAEYLNLPVFVYLYYEDICGVVNMHYDVLIDLCHILNIDYHKLKGE
ncbi:XRE family transcriptional regulator [[Clostridium] innocuum]|nr:XRE family transcriptional regulator [[Clostridium] innocuum]